MDPYEVSQRMISGIQKRKCRPENKDLLCSMLVQDITELRKR